MTREQSASRLIDATAEQVRAVLLDPLSLPDWNPALRGVTGRAMAAVGEGYPITVRPGLAGHFRYTSIEPDRIDTRWEVPGFTETGSWQLRRHGNQTDVSHRFVHAGPIATALSRAYRGAAELRLARLDARVRLAAVMAAEDRHV